MADLEDILQNYVANNPPPTEEPEIIPEPEKAEEMGEPETSLIVQEQQPTVALPIVPQEQTQSNLAVGGLMDALGEQMKAQAQQKIADGKVVDKHADTLAKLVDKKMSVEAESTSLQIEDKAADNKVHKQEIKNRLIVLNAEAKRLAREQKQLDKEQKADHKARNKKAKWELYKDKLIKMRYTYVPCGFILALLLFFDGVCSFFEGIGAVSTAMMKAVKWILIITIIIIILMSIPVTRVWLIGILSGGF